MQWKEGSVEAGASDEKTSRLFLMVLIFACEKVKEALCRTYQRKDCRKRAFFFCFLNESFLSFRKKTRTKTPTVMIFSLSHSPSSDPAGSPSCGGDFAAYVFNIGQPSLPTPFHSVLVGVSVFMALSTVFHSINSPDNSPLSQCSSGLMSAVLVLSTTYLFLKVSFSPDIIICG